MARFQRQLLAALASIGSMLMPLTPGTMSAQTTPTRLRGMQSQQTAAPGNTHPAAPAQATPAQSTPTQATPAQPTPAAEPLPASLLQQPAQPAHIVFSGDSLAIHADNSSLTSILRQIAAKNGMRIEGLDADERVFGNFGPGTPSDVLADLLNGTAYNVVLLGDLASGGELILTPATRTGATPSTPSPQTTPPADEVSTEAPEEPPQPEAQPPVPTPPAAPGVRTPQQLFEQLQHLRQQQQQQQQQPSQ